MLQENPSNMTTPKQDPAQPVASETEEVVVPIVDEELHVDKRQIETGRIRLTKMVHEREVIVDEPFTREEIQVERVPVDRLVTEPVSVRYEGDTMIIPVMEELIVVEKRLRLKEELRVTKRQITTPQSRPVRVRTEEVHVERVSTQERLRSDE